MFAAPSGYTVTQHLANQLNRLGLSSVRSYNNPTIALHWNFSSLHGTDVILWMFIYQICASMYPIKYKFPRPKFLNKTVYTVHTPFPVFTYHKGSWDNGIKDIFTRYWSFICTLCAMCEYKSFFNCEPSETFELKFNRNCSQPQPLD